MRRMLAASLLLAAAPFCVAADLAAGKAKVESVCAACHGANGVSVSEGIPNLAGQRAPYLVSQLKALKDGTRKNAIMNAIAAQLGAEDMANVAAYFSSLPGAASGAKSALLANVAHTRVAFPTRFPAGFTPYHSVSDPDSKQVTLFFANEAAIEAARSGRPLPEGAVVVGEIRAAKLDARGDPVRGADGAFVADKLLAYSAMERQSGWGRDIPAMLRNGDWNYAVFTADAKPRAGVNQAVCLACHKPREDASYVFTLKELASASHGAFR